MTNAQPKPASVAVEWPVRCPSTYAGNTCAFVKGHDHPHGVNDSDYYVTWGRMASEQQPTLATTIGRWQHRAGDWTASRFPDDDLKQRGLVLGEETGEVLRCILKAEQGIRGGREKWLAELPAEAADVFFCLAALASRAGFDLSRAIEDRWRELSQRTYDSERVER